MATDESKAEADWFAGGVDRAQSKALLAGQPDNTFLVRKSSQAGCYSIDVVVTGGYLAVLVLPGKTGGVICSAVPLLGVAERPFATLADLVAGNSGIAAGRDGATRGAVMEGEEEDSILMMSGGGKAARSRREGEEEDSLLMAAEEFDPHAARGGVSRGVGHGAGHATQWEGEEEDSMLMAADEFDPAAMP